MKFAVIDGDGFPIAFYASDVHGTNIPADATEISDDQWREFIDNPGLRQFIDGNVAVWEPPAPVNPIPNITRRQLRLWLVRQGIALSDVEAAIEALPEPGRTEAQIEWADASTYERSNPLIESIGTTIGLTPEEIDDGFRNAALI